jgi:site-specific recombinase XerD
MSRISDPSNIQWDRYPAIAEDPLARKWLESQVLLGLAQNTVEAYARGVQDFMGYCVRSGIHAQQATRNEVACYVGDLRCRPNPKGGNIVQLDSGVGLSNATLQRPQPCWPRPLHTRQEIWW